MMLSQQKPASLFNKLAFVCLTIMIAGELAFLALGWSLLAWVAKAGFAALCVFAMPWATIREKSLFTMALVLTGIHMVYDGSLAPISDALMLATFFGAFIALLTVMKEAAERSASVLAVGRYLTSRPAGRRYYATAIGSHILGVFLNFGAVSLMSPLIQKSAVNLDGTPNPDLERRQLSAQIRGFSWVLLWAPTTLSQAVLLTVFSDVKWRDFVVLGLVSAAVMIVIGRLYDRFEWRHATLPAPHAGTPFPVNAAGIILVICTALIGLTFTGQYFGATIAEALMFVAPTITLVWFVLQDCPSFDIATIARRMACFKPILRNAAPSITRSALALGLSGYIGRLAAAVLPMEQIASHLNLSAIPGWLFLAILPALITLGGQIALSPILLVVFLGEVLKTITDLPAPSAHILFALSTGWALSMTASPNATATLLISAVTKVPPTSLTWKWNLKYGLLCYGAFVLIFIGIS